MNHFDSGHTAVHGRRFILSFRREQFRNRDLPGLNWDATNLNLFPVRCARNNERRTVTRVHHIRDNGRDLHGGPRLIIQIELCRPIDTFSGGGFSNLQVGRRGFAGAREAS